MGAPEPTHPFQSSADWHGESMNIDHGESRETLTTGEVEIELLRTVEQAAVKLMALTERVEWIAALATDDEVPHD